MGTAESAPAVLISAYSQCESLCNPFRTVQPQESQRPAPNDRKRINEAGVKPEMICPLIATRIEQQDRISGRRIDRSDVAAFIAVAEDAGVCQVLKIGGTTVLAAHDVIDLMRKTDIVLVDKAVFATMSSAGGYARADLPSDVSGHARGSGELSP